jgi:hypothetical protein
MWDWRQLAALNITCMLLKYMILGGGGDLIQKA